MIRLDSPPMDAICRRVLTPFLAAILFWSVPTHGDDPPIYLSKTDPERAALLRSRPWIETIEKEVPPLNHDTRGRMPMVMWHGVGNEPLGANEIAILRKRGLCQHLPFHEAWIPAAKVLADAGMPVILLEGRMDSWPYSLADERKLPQENETQDDATQEGATQTRWTPGDWAHQFDPTFVPPWFGKDDSSQWHGACPNHIDGWSVLEQRTRATMQKFKEAGVRVDAVMVDFEGDPYPWPHLFEQLRHCRRCREELPPDVVQNRSAWSDYSWTQYVDLYDRYFAKPIREVFPDALVTNWHVVFSSREVPVRDFVQDVSLPPLRPQYFSATNPVAYASDAAWRKHWMPEGELTQTAVDDFYSNEIIHQVESDRRNRELAGATSVRSIPWVARVCRIEADPSPELLSTELPSTGVPVMSRERYGKSLAELWKLGVHSMQIFNPMHDGYEELALTELQDAVAAYDAMLGQPQ